MGPRVRPNGLSSLCCRVPWCLACGQMVSVLCVAAPHSAAHLYAAAPPWCRACGQMVSVLCVAAFHGSAQFYVLPRPMVPRSSLCAASHGAAQFYMLPRPMVPRYILRAGAPRSLVPRSLRAVALHGAARGTTHRVFALLPRGGLDCYKRAARSTVGVSRSTAIVEVGRRRIDVEVSRSAALVKYGRRRIV